MPGTNPKDVQKPQAASQPSQKSMTKAERRELQERQRAAKAAQKQQPEPSTSKAKGPSTPQKKGHAPSESKRSAPNGIPAKDTPSGLDNESKAASLRIFSHFNSPKPLGLGVKGNIHPAILRLAIQFAEFKICGANARCIATLNAFKTVIQDYVTPPNNTLSRHLMSHLSPQITHLVSARPMSITTGNAIRQLKLEISGSDIDLPEQDAKDELCQKIDTYIRERIIVAGEVIQDLANKKIKDGDTILTYARSSVIEKVLLAAHETGKRFTVIVIDSRPLLEGKSLLHVLTSTTPPIPCTYALLPAVPSLITGATTVLLGAHSLHSNGAVYSRAGTAMVAMIAKERAVPVMVCSETYKFSESILLDGFGKNEIAPQTFSGLPTQDNKINSLQPLYDLTPPSCITAVVTEVGLIPPSSISSVPHALGRVIL